MAFLSQPLSVYPIWNPDGTPNTRIVQGNDSDPRDNGNDHLAGTPLEWAYDFPVPVGTPVHAVADGVVEYVNMDAMAGHPNRLGYGNVITIRSVNSDGEIYYTTYAHLSGASVTSGDPVTAGKVIGSSGDSGAPGAPHLHIQFGTVADSEVLDGARAGGTNYGFVADGINDATAPAFFSVPNSPLTMLWDPADDPKGLNATDVIYHGTAGDDVFVGNGNGDFVHGRNGNDRLIGGQGNDIIFGDAGNDVLNGAPGRDVVAGGAGADTFVFDAAALTDARSTTPVLDEIVDYNQGNHGTLDLGEGDLFDLSQLVSSAYNSGQSVSSLVRVVEDASGVFARLQIDSNGTAGGANWISIARLDAIHQGNTFKVILDPFHTPVSVTSGAATINSLDDLAAVRNYLSGQYILGANIDAPGAIIAPIGSSTNPFTGTFDGNGHTINGLHIVGNDTYVGLFAEVGAGGKISNLGLTNLSVSAPRGYDVGGLVGRNMGTIENSYTTGTVSGTAGNFVSGLNGIAIGGVAGWNFGTITGSYSSATITSDSTIFVDLGGLAGGNSGTIDHSHANGTIIGHSGTYGSGLVEIGGLVGSLGFGTTGGKIQNSYTTGSVISDGSNTAAGGLVGASVSNSTIFQSYATGSVSTGGPSWDGGLVGILFNGTIWQSFAKGSVTVGNGGDAGGLVGQMNSGTIFESYAKGPATGGTGSDVGGLVSHSYGGSITQSYATGKVTAGSLAIAGGLVAQNGSLITNSYWDVQSTGQSTSSGGIPIADFFLKLGILPTGFDPAVWSENILLNTGYPYLKWQKVIDGNISGALVFADDNNNGTLDPDELFTVTDSGGYFEPIGEVGPLVAYGGIDTSTGLPFKGLLAAPVGSTVITPLTTLISSLQSQGDPIAKQKVLAAFGLSSDLDLTTFDPIAAVQAGDIAGTEVSVAVAKAYNTVSLIASALVGAGGTFLTGASGAFAAIATVIGGPGVNLADNATLSALISNIAQSN
ncbi:GLUG motif-containing protein [Bradyrhizobium liaoningense]|uniref:GLUG motif-containing protein n=1 Tax=Bradyrhizobium liaoningense TaxID=43992 RepID=UPI0004B76EF8|nr:GLUG motif-containing protein [Bradyrhizobium liaoningense]